MSGWTRGRSTLRLVRVKLGNLGGCRLGYTATDPFGGGRGGSTVDIGGEGQLDEVNDV